MVYTVLSQDTRTNVVGKFTTVMTTINVMWVIHIFLDRTTLVDFRRWNVVVELHMLDIIYLESICGFGVKRVHKGWN